MAILAAAVSPQEFMDEVEDAMRMEETLQELFRSIRTRVNGSPSTDNYIVGDINAHAERFKSISEDLKMTEDHYLECLGSLSDANFSDETIEDCVGNEFSKITNDIIFFKKKILGKADTHIRTDFVELCYDQAEDEIMLQNCDLLEKDVIDFLWAEINIYRSADINRERYLTISGSLNEETFIHLIDRLKPLYDELSELLQEIRDHHISIIESVKESVEQRTKLILMKAKESGGYSPLPKMQTHTVHITQTLNQRNVPNVHTMPSVLMDGSMKLYADSDRPKKPVVYNPENFQDLYNGPSVVIPVRKLEKRMEALRQMMRQKKKNEDK